MAGYIGTTPVPQATQHRESFTATGGQTSFATAGYTPQFIDVYLNGVKLAPADYTAANGSDVVLASGATASDILEIVAYTPFEVANQTFTGDTSVTNLAVTGTFTSRGIDDNADAVAITIDSSENVGIGVTPETWSTSLTTRALQVGSVTSLWEVAGQYSSFSSNHYYDTSNTQRYITSNPATRYFQQNGEHVFMGAPSGTAGNTVSFSEYGRFDSSGNLLVGKTTIATGTAGIALRSNGEVRGTANGDYAARFSRLSSDGAIVGFEKDNVAVGSIGIQTGGLTIDGEINHTGLMFAGASVLPRDNSANTDGTIDLGTTDGRWKDLYLSGSVYADLIRHKDDTDTYIRWPGNNTLAFNTGAAERMRLDASGNLLVGMTSNGITSTGIGLVRDGTSHMYSGGTHTLELGRGTNDGDILKFNRSGSTVGSISVVGSRMNIGTGDVAIRFDDTNNAFIPWNVTTNSANADSIDFGDNTDRFKDLYLSGGVYLGGTGAANKLDDYEEGTFSPVMEGSTSGTFTSLNLGRYTKIGRSVSIQLTFNNITYNAVVGNLKITNLPFATNTTDTVDLYVPVQVYRLDWPSDAKDIYGFQNSSNSTQLELFYSRDNNTSAQLLGTHLAGTYFRMTWSYNTA